MAVSIGRRALATAGVLLVVLLLGGQSLTKVAELTEDELTIVALASALIAAAMFAAAVRWLRKPDQYIGALIVAALVSLLIAGVVMERVRGPACLGDEVNDPALCEPPPAEIVDWDAWWQGWSAAATLMTLSGCIGFIGGALLSLRRPSASTARD